MPKKNLIKNKLITKSRKAQMKMMENVAVMIIFFMLLSLDIEKYVQQQAVKLAKVVAALPEVRCSEENVPVQDCFDLLRVEETALKTKDLNTQRYYFEILGYSRVAIEEKYPGNGIIEVYDNQPNLAQAASIEEITFNYIPIYIPITLFNATTNQYSFGVLEVGTYDK
ncbi:hypothetical protein J4206_06995 [Candidatus Woesearchaeota archaeon]|nr:hypothetical protein [Candidatus Woesearchaeota archaeon]